MSKLTHDDKIELDRLNGEVDQAITNRTEWLDSKMPHYAKVQVGDDIYNLGTGKLLGEVSSLYRYQASQNKLFDTSLSIEYEFKEPYIDSCFGNTSCIYVLVGTKDDLINTRRVELNYLKKESKRVINQSANQQQSKEL